MGLGLRRATRPRDSEESVLPLINVVFLLLIFFMIAGQISATDPFRVQPPRSVSEESAGRHELTVLVSDRGEIAVDGEPVALDALERVIAEHRSPADGILLRLKADGRADSQRVIEVLERLRAAGIEGVDLLTITEAE